MTRKSDFGRGYATCLRQFTFHAARLDESIASYERMRAKRPDLFTEADAVEMWFNSSSDHLYELVRPRRGVPAAEWKRARALADRALDIGHGFRASSKSTVEEARRLIAEATDLLVAIKGRGTPVTSLDDAMAADRTFGLAPVKGDWSCTEDLRRTLGLAASMGHLPRRGMDRCRGYRVDLDADCE